MRFIPGGTMIESVCVSATPIMPSLTASSTNQAQAPQCELLRATTAPTPLSFAREIASCMARCATSWPMPASPSTTAAEGAGAPHRDARARLHAAVAQPPRVVGEAHHAVAVDAAQVRRDQRLGDEPRVGALEAELLEARRGE